MPVPPGTLSSPGAIVLPREAAHYVHHVLRMAAGDELTLFDGEGRRAHGRLMGEGRVEVATVEEVPPDDGPQVTLICGLSKGDKIEWVVEKVTELGAHAVWPVVTARSVVQLKEERAAGKLERWRRVASAAARQCGRDHGLVVHPATPVAQALEECAATHKRILQPGGSPLGPGLPVPMDTVALLVGPEGGFTPDEVTRAEHAGFVVAGLGPLVLRAETAPLAALASVLARAGRL